MNAPRLFRNIVPALLSTLLLITPAPGKDGGNRSSFRGPLPDEQREIIQLMASKHDQLKRKVKINDKGYSATTTTADKELAAKLKEHVAYMKKRLDSGAMVRRWDPAFEEMVEYHDQLDTLIRDLPNGIEVVVTGKTPEAIKVAQNHAKIVSGFVKEGDVAVQREHKPALAEPRKKDGAGK